MSTKWHKVNIWQRGICKTVDIRYRNSLPRLECYRDASEHPRTEAARLELHANDREVK